ASTVAESRPPERRTTARPATRALLAAQGCEARARLAGGLRGGIARDEVLQRVARAAHITLLGLDRRDREQGVGRLGRLRVLREQLLLRGERVAVVLHVRVADADPVGRVGRKLALRIVLEEGAERVHRRGEVVAPEEARGRVVGLHL